MIFCTVERLMNKYYQINLPTGMAPVHPDLYSTVILSLSARGAHSAFVSGTFPKSITCKSRKINLSDTSDQDIFQFNLHSNQKKEVRGINNIEVQHCKSIQYDMNCSPDKNFLTTNCSYIETNCFNLRIQNDD